MNIPYVLRKPCSFLHTGVCSLKPEKISVGPELDRTLGRSRQARTVVVEAFPRSRNVPVELNGGACNGGRQLTAPVNWDIGNLCNLLFVFCGFVLV